MHALASEQTVIIAPSTPDCEDGQGGLPSTQASRRVPARAAEEGVPAALLGEYLEDAMTTAFACEEYGSAFADDDEETCVSPRAATVASPPWDIALNEVIARACARDRRDRFGDARAMLGALGAIRTQ